MHQCVKCGATTEGGQFYRFYFGVVEDGPASEPTPEGEPVDSGPIFHSRGSEEAYFCDRCISRAAARGEKIRSGFFLALGLFAILVVVLLVLASSPGLWAGLVALLLVVALGGAAYLRYRHLHAALCSNDQDQLRHAVSTNPKLQNMGDDWAIDRRRQELLKEGAELFLSRAEYEFWSQSNSRLTGSTPPEQD